MRVKRYIVDSLPDAVPLIRTELGKEAVILETKEVKVGGFMGMFKKRKIEVLAAIEPNQVKQDNKTKPLNDDEVGLFVEQIIKASQRSKGNQESSTDTTNESQVAKSTPEGASFASRLYGGTQPNKALQEEKGIFPEAAGNTEPENVISNDNDILNETKKMSATETFIVNELKNLRKEMINLSRKAPSSQHISSSIQALINRLQEQELEKQWIDVLSEELLLQEQQFNSPLEPEVVWDYARGKFQEWLEPYQDGCISKTTRIIQFVGPTGVGKTTTIAKLAANYSIKDNKKVGLITADTYRIAAVEQLRTYANILNIPLEVVFSPLDLERANQALEASEIVIMDTAGRNYKSDLYVSEVNSLLPSLDNSESVLVLSVTSRTTDMRIIAEKFSKYGVRKAVFTKLDESNTYGVIFNMILMFGLIPLFITSGQNVPDDIETFQINKFIDMLLGEPHHA